MVTPYYTPFSRANETGSLRVSRFCEKFELGYVD